MADQYVSVGADDYFTHIMQAYGILKSDPSQRRAVADLIVGFLNDEKVHVDFASSAPEPVIEQHAVALPEEDDADITEEVS